MLNEAQIAIVGSRQPTATGKQVAFNFAADLCRLGLTITSGMAKGIDGCSHRGALSVQGNTIAVLGHGFDTVYPAQHKELAAEIANGGALVSEFLPDVHIACETCKGKRFNRETLEVRFKGKSIADVLDMTVEQAVSFFENQPKIQRKVQTLHEVGLGYLTLGQQATTLSGGEAQRVKLAEELSKRDTGKTIYILDEPTTGLHFQDIKALMEVLQKLVDKGNTVLIIEHNLDVIKVSDHVIDLGPDGGRNGGQIIAEGTPEQVAKVKGSFTAHFLKEELS